MSDKHFEALPKMHTTYANIIKSLLPIGDQPKVSKDQLPKSTYVVDALQIDQSHLKDYRRICGFFDNGYVPITYFSVLSQTLQMNMMVQEPFPFALLGLVHIENSVTQYRPISDEEVVSMAVSFANLKDHARGQQFDFITKVMAADGDLIWEGSSTYLARSRNKTDEAKKLKVVNPKPAISEGGIHVKFDVPEDIGRRYAFVSGDFNLIHLHAISARAFGFPKAVAHGMWSQAKCLAQFKELPKAYRADVSFKLPIFLPTEVELIGDPIDKLHEDQSLSFGLYNAKNDKLHLLGSIKSVQGVSGLFSEKDLN